MKTRMMILATCLVISSALVGADEIPAPQVDNTPEPEAITFTSEHEIQIGGQRLRYTATAGTLIMRNEEGEPIAEFGYTAYARKDTNPATRPIGPW